MQSVFEPLTVLIAEDSAADRLLLSTIVRRQGHAVLTASNGAEAVALFEQQRPQLVLMDAMMPVMDGFEAARQIKQLAGETLVPIIFLTSLTESEALARCLDAGGDDFLAKPYNQIILGAKIKAMDRLRRLQATVLQQRDQIARHHDYLLNEQRVAKAVFDKVAHSGCLKAPNIRYLQSPYALFNGDLLLAAFTPAGDMHVLLGDFTGHGSPAAVGAMPLAEVFYGMTAKGFGLPETLREMNAKLKRILPVDMFCCATMLCLSFQRRAVEVWNGGMPDGYLHCIATGERRPLVSRHLPLGVLGAQAFDDRTEVFPMALGDRIFLLSDGVIDTCDANEQLFGVERLERVFALNQQPDRLFEEIEQALKDFRGQARDDVSMVEVSLLLEAQQLSPPVMVYSDSGQSSPLDWSVSFEFRAATLKRFNPLPYLLQLLLEVHGLRAHSGALYSVMAELYSNALEHGVLGLDSSLKDDARGFAQYYQQRNARLNGLEEGYVRVHLQVEPQGEGGCLVVRIEDSGAGFDVQRVMARPIDAGKLSGRGVSLIRQLSHSARWSDDGRSARVEFSWEALA
jgi:CheY-like chemotaxis protein